MDGRLSKSSEHRTLSGRASRRVAIKFALGMGAVFAAGAVRHDAESARRGYPGPALSIGGGYVVTILEGIVPGTIEYRVDRSLSIGRYLTFHNLTSSQLEIEVVPPGGSALQEPLASDAFLFVRIEQSGIVRFRAWPAGGQPGAFLELEFPG